MENLRDLQHLESNHICGRNASLWVMLEQFFAKGYMAGRLIRLHIPAKMMAPFLDVCAKRFSFRGRTQGIIFEFVRQAGGVIEQRC